MKLFSDQIPPPDEPLPDQILLRVGWVEGLMMTGACLAFSLGALWLIVTGKGGLAVIALFVFAPGLYLGWRQIRTGGYFVLLSEERLVRSDYGHKDEWLWGELDRCTVGTRRGVEGVWCRFAGEEASDEVLIETGGRDVRDLARLINQFQHRADRHARRMLIGGPRDSDFDEGIAD